VIRVIEETLTAHHVSYIKAKTWTTDAFYRETPGKIQLRKHEGCAVVEMETAAFIAVSQYLGVDFGQILYAGDDLTGEVWDSRQWHTRAEIRSEVLRLAMETAIRL
jgi:purine-nucleoside phosphorylase